MPEPENCDGAAMTGGRLRLERFLFNSIAYLFWILSAGIAASVGNDSVAADRLIMIASPSPWQVIQRVGFDPSNAVNAEPGSSAFGAIANLGQSPFREVQC